MGAEGAFGVIQMGISLCVSDKSLGSCFFLIYLLFWCQPPFFLIHSRNGLAGDLRYFPGKFQRDEETRKFHDPLY